MSTHPHLRRALLKLLTAAGTVACLLPLEAAGDAYRRVLSGSMERIVLAP
ncbi:MAG: hypothetical protein H7Z19_07160, partial [Chitinophagaceae bacterium]|nr:hypothetical protein [Rubrivivax sp.]